MTILAFSGILIGLVFGQLTKYLKDKTLAAMIFLMGLGNLIFTFATHSAFFILAALLIGASFVGTMSSVFDYIAKHFKKEHNHFVTSLAITAGNIGVILTPVLLCLLYTSPSPRD